MIFRIAINILSMAILFWLQSGFISGLPLLFSHINIILIALVFILILRGLPIALYWALALGLLFDFYFFLPAGSHLLIFIIGISLVNIFLTSVFTNRSLYSFLALSGLMIVVCRLCFYLIGYSEQFITGKAFMQFSSQTLWSEAAGLMINLIITAILFYLVSAVSKQLKPVFVKK